MTHELIINGTTYEFNFGYKFLKEINKRATQTVPNLNIENNIGLTVSLAKIAEDDIEELFSVLYLGNKGYSPRLEESEFTKWIDSEGTDIDEVFGRVKGFFMQSNCCRKTMQTMMAMASE